MAVYGILSDRLSFYCLLLLSLNFSIIHPEHKMFVYFLRSYIGLEIQLVRSGRPGDRVGPGRETPVRALCGPCLGRLFALLPARAIQRAADPRQQKRESAGVSLQQCELAFGTESQSETKEVCCFSILLTFQMVLFDFLCDFSVAPSSSFLSGSHHQHQAAAVSQHRASPERAYPSVGARLSQSPTGPAQGRSSARQVGVWDDECESAKVFCLCNIVQF